MGKSMRKEVAGEVIKGMGATLGFRNGICCLDFSSV